MLCRRRRQERRRARRDAEGDLLAARLCGAAFWRARLSVAAKLWEPPAAETGLAVGAEPVPSKEARAWRWGQGNVRMGAARTRLGAPVLRPALYAEGGGKTAAFLRSRGGACLGREVLELAERCLPESVCHRVRRAGACLDKHGGTVSEIPRYPGRGDRGPPSQEPRKLFGRVGGRGRRGCRKGGALYNASY